LRVRFVVHANTMSSLMQVPLHGDEKGSAGVMTTALAVVCQMAGMGILQLAYMLRQGGWVCLGLIVACAACTNYTGKLLVACCYVRDDDTGVLRREYASYIDIGEAAFGKYGRMCTRVFENMTLFGVSTLFLILAGKFIGEIIPDTYDTRTWIMIGAAIVAIPVLIFRTVGELKFLAFFGVLAVAAVVLGVIEEASRYEFGAEHRAAHTDVILAEGFVPAFSAMALAFAAHAGLPAVERSMDDPKKFTLAFNAAYAIVLVLYLPMSVVGYSVYGDQVYSPILCSLPRDSWVPKVAKALMTVHVLLTFPVLMTLFIMELEKSIRLSPGSDSYIVKRTLVRAVVVAASASVAVFVPYFDTMMSLVGAICVVMTTFVLPAVFYIKLRARTWTQRIVPALVALIGTVGGAIGAVQASTELWGKLQSGASPNDA